MPTCADIRLLASYNAHMNGKLYEAAAQLPPGEATAARGAFFGSLLATMNHLVVADTIWLKRFTEHPAGFPALLPLRDVLPPTSLTQPFGDDLATLQVHRTRLDGLIDGFAAQLQPADLEHVLVYRSTKGVAYGTHFGTLLLHFFNHQTHHRGQATTLLTQAGVDIGVTDLLAFIR